MNPHDFALIAQEAYTAKPDIGDAGSASRAILRQTDAGLVVAFPGSDNIPCWIADLDAIPIPIPGIGSVHRGFWGAWSAIAPQVIAAVGKKPVILVGHSLGAAIALMSACSMTVAGMNLGAAYGFEPPRVALGDGVSKLLAKVPVFLCKNGNDLVPDLPIGFDHGGHVTDIGKAILPIPNVQDHFMDRVLPALVGVALEPRGNTFRRLAVVNAG